MFWIVEKRVVYMKMSVKSFMRTAGSRGRSKLTRYVVWLGLERFRKRTLAYLEMNKSKTLRKRVNVCDYYLKIIILMSICFN